MVEFLEEALHIIVHISQIALELAGIIILIIAGVKCIIVAAGKKENARLAFASQISLALEFLMAGEIIHTVVAEEPHELISLGAIIVFRAILGWEINKEEKELEEKMHEKSDHERPE